MNNDNNRFLTRTGTRVEVTLPDGRTVRGYVAYCERTGYAVAIVLDTEGIRIEFIRN